jgi:DUF1680 family protein
MPVRAHGSHPHLDATRGAIAVARGPLVYCLEQQDAAVPVDDLVVSANEVVRAVAVPQPDGAADDPLAGAVLLRAAMAAAPAASPRLYPELAAGPAGAGPQAPQQDPPAPRAVPVTLVPYFLWGNRGPEAMRVWLRAQ